MKNKLILAILILLISNCSKDKGLQNSLVIPPAIDELPDPNNPEKSRQNSSDEDLEELKELLLKN
jgi:hypothetical protein